MDGVSTMFNDSPTSLRLRSLEKHLKQENPILAEVVRSFRELDRISRRIGYFDREESHAIRTPWWPLISVLGVYSSGKSTFINHYLQYGLQATGNQAVDDRFTVLCFTKEKKVRVLPGLALDADPRFPLYKISQAIKSVAQGEGDHVNAFLQLKTCPSEKLRGKILIDSPGFDADAQRTSTLRITDHIMDLSDLVLVFFDARHPEIGSMHDTLKHLVHGTIHRRDSNKFLYILNQFDNTAREDNPEEVFAAWQRALAQHGMTAGSCYAIYDPKVAIPIENANLRARFEAKRDADVEAINNRIEQVGVERAYRIVGMLEQSARMLDQEIVPRLQRFIDNWRRKVLWAEGIILGLALIAFGTATIWGGYWNGLRLELPLWDLLTKNNSILFTGLAILLLIAGCVHFSVRRRIARLLTHKFLAEVRNSDQRSHYSRAFRKNSSWRRSLFHLKPAGWSQRTQGRLTKVLEDTHAYIQKLNDKYTSPSGEVASEEEPGPPPWGSPPKSDLIESKSQEPLPGVARQAAAEE
ncbi:MAG: dynamin family protein [Desulfobacterales bacterium]|nr:MAG: dynamin family protein [Desulfobacterales bacterium]